MTCSRTPYRAAVVRVARIDRGQSCKSGRCIASHATSDVNLMDDAMQQGTPEPADPLYSNTSELMPSEDQLDARPTKQARLASADTPVKPIPSSNRPSILRSVVKGASLARPMPCRDA